MKLWINLMSTILLITIIWEKEKKRLWSKNERSILAIFVSKMPWARLIQTIISNRYWKWPKHITPVVTSMIRIYSNSIRNEILHMDISTNVLLIVEVNKIQARPKLSRMSIIALELSGMEEKNSFLMICFK